MGKTRNERRKAAQARLLAKQERIARAELGRQAQERRKIVQDNLSTGKPKRQGYALVNGTITGGNGFYPESPMGRFASKSHRGYVCRA